MADDDDIVLTTLERVRLHCTCYVRRLDAETVFALRRGAHATTCPCYRPSVDPVDRDEDADFRDSSSRPYGVPGLV